MIESLVFQYTFFIIFLILSAFFSSSETAFTAVSHIKMRSLIKHRSASSIILERIYKHPKKLLTAILIGNNVANVATTTIATTVLLQLLSTYGIENIALAMTIITITVTTVLLVVGEITPKTLSLKNPEKFVLFFSRPINYYLILMTPIIYIFDLFSLLFTKLFGLSQSEERQLITLEEMKTMLDVGREEGVLEKEKNEMLHSIFDFSDTVVREIMTPRTDTVCIGVNHSILDVIHLIIEKGHSRIPVFEDKIDNILGIVYAKDLLNVSKADSKESIRKFMRDAVFIPETKNIEALLQQMKRSRFHMAIVVDEHGGMAGIVTLEDIVEEIIGEIQDEYDKDDFSLCQRVGPNKYEVDATMNIKDLGEEIEIIFPETDEYDTIGGFVLTLLGKFPIKGEEIDYDDLLTITIKDIRKRRIMKVLIHKKTTS